MEEQPVIIRHAIQSDVNFILNSILKSYRSSFFAKQITNTIYFTQHEKLLKAILPKSMIHVAVNPDDPTQIFGFILFQTYQSANVIHYIYVKEAYRKMNIGKLLLSSIPIESTTVMMYTHATHMSEKLAAKYKFIYNPYLFYNSIK